MLCLYMNDVDHTGHSIRIGLALGGGAARGFAHIGVLKVLEEENIPVHMVAGTSVGSLVGSLYCAGFRWQEIASFTKDVNWGQLAKPIWPTNGLVSSEKLEQTLNSVLKSSTFADLKLPFSAVAVDISQGEVVVLEHGAVAPAVRASCSIPGIFTPTEIDGRMLVDGGVLNSVPADVVRAMGADVVIAVNLNSDRKKNGKPENVIDMLFYSFNLMVSKNTETTLRAADVVIEPDLRDLGYYSLKKHDVAIARGEEAARRLIERIRARIS